MARKGDLFAGVTVAMLTPFTDSGAVDYDALEQLVDWHVEEGTDCLAPVGTTGESPTLDHDEHREVISRVIKKADGRIKIMAGTGSNSTQEALELTQFAKDSGADGALIVGPYYNKPTQEGYLQHYLTIADKVDIPIVVYNIPGRTASNIEAATINKMGEHPNIVAAKEATGSMDQASMILAGSNLTILSGDDSLTLPLMSLGASGVVSVVGNIVPRDLKTLTNHAAAGQWDKAQAAHYKLFALCRDMLSLATNPIPVKAAHQMLGRGSGKLRLPLVPLNSDQEATLRKTLTAYGLL